LGEIDGENVRDIRVLAELSLENGTGKKHSEQRTCFAEQGSNRPRKPDLFIRSAALPALTIKKQKKTVPRRPPGIAIWI
jgi:hypothetical protein